LLLLATRRRCVATVGTFGTVAGFVSLTGSTCAGNCQRLAGMLLLGKQNLVESDFGSQASGSQLNAA